MADTDNMDDTRARPVPGHPRTAIEDSHTSVMGETHSPSDRRGLPGTEAIHANSSGMNFRAGNPPPEYLKWYVGQGGITGTRSGTPFATHQPHEAREASPTVGWDPAETNATDANIAGGEARQDRADERKDVR